MIIREITIENFRSYYGINTIKFNDGLTIFIGDNGDGKTTFFEALEWLFDTLKQNIDTRLISEKKISEMHQFESDVLRVSMTFDHDGEKVIEKSFAFKKAAENSIKTSDFQFKGFQNVGPERDLIDGSVLLERCFETIIRKYSLFKGEENLNVFNDPAALKYLIETFSDVRDFEPYYTGDDERLGFTEYAEYQSRKAFEKAMRSDKQNSQQEKEISSKLDLLRNKVGDIRQRLKSNRENAANFSNLLGEIENSKEASELLKDINERLKSLRDRRTKVEVRINEDYAIRLLDDMWILCGFPAIFEEFQEKVSTFSKTKRKQEREADKLKGKQELVNEITEGFIPLSPNVPDMVSMKEMILEEFCKVCGREAKEGTDAYVFMVDKLNNLIKSQQPRDRKVDKPLFPNNFLRELEQRSHNLEYHQSEIHNLFNDIKDAIEFNEARKAELKQVQESIDFEEISKKKLLAQNDSLTEAQLQNAYENITNWWEYKSQAEKQVLLLEKEESEVQNELERYQDAYNNLAKTSVAATHSKIHNALDKIRNAFKEAKERNTQNFLIHLEENANQYLKRLNVDGFFGVIRIIRSPDGTARIALQDSNNKSIFSPNQALKTTMYMSILFAVSDLTALKRENDYPLIFDAPTSSFSSQKENDFFKVIAAINKQCLIFTKSFLKENGDLDNARIEIPNCRIYRMEKQRPFNNLDLSTIQTKLTLIKL